MNPTGYRAVNLALHIVETLLIWFILRKLSIPGAFLAALIFAVHPVNVESVAWIAQLRNMLSMSFFLLSTLCYLQAETQPPASQNRKFLRVVDYWYGLSLVLFILAILSKGSSAILPVMLLGIIWWRRGSLIKWDLVGIAPFFLASILFTGVNIWFQTHGSGEAVRTAGFVERLLGAGGVVWFYLYKAILPYQSGLRLSAVANRGSVIRCGGCRLSVCWRLPVYYGVIEKVGAGRFFLPGDFSAWRWCR